MSRQYWVSPIPPIHSTSGAVKATFTAFAAFTSPTVTLPANILEVGSEVHLEADGEYSATANTVTWGLGFLWGATTLASGTAVAGSGSTPASFPWHAEYNFRVRAIGGSGVASIQGSGWWTIGSTLTAFILPQAMPATLALRTVSSGIDTGTAAVLAPGVVCGTSSASNTITCDRFSVHLVS